MRLLRIPEPFDHPDFLFGPKLDGFRALAHIDGHRCTLVSRNGNTFMSWPQLCEELAHAVRCKSAVVDGEICCVDPDGRTNFNRLLFRRDWPFFYAFDLLMLNGRDLRALPLTERKRRLATIMPELRAGCCFSTASRSAGAICSALRVSAIWKASWPSASSIPIYWTEVLVG